LTPVKFTPFAKQAMAGHRFRKMSQNDGPIAERLGIGDQAPGPITIKSRLSDTVRFSNLNGVYTALPNSIARQSKDRPSTFSKISEMYQWLKERINEHTYVEQNVAFTFKLQKVILTPDLLELINECDGDVAWKIMLDRQTELAGRI
jgi:hypothetical protein